MSDRVAETNYGVWLRLLVRQYATPIPPQDRGGAALQWQQYVIDEFYVYENDGVGDTNMLCDKQKELDGIRGSETLCLCED